MIEITTGERKEGGPFRRGPGALCGVFAAREKGEDYKIIAVPVADPRFEGVKDLTDLHPHWLKEIENFFEAYKALEPRKAVRLAGWAGRDHAWSIIKSCRKR